MSGLFRLPEGGLPWRVPTAIAVLALLGTCTVRPGVVSQAHTVGALRVATYNSPTAYYLGAHGPEGPEYALASRFARSLGLRLEMIEYPSAAAAISAVAHGRAHIAAAGLAGADGAAGFEDITPGIVLEDESGVRQSGSRGLREGAGEHRGQEQRGAPERGGRKRLPHLCELSAHLPQVSGWGESAAWLTRKTWISSSCCSFINLVSGSAPRLWVPFWM